MQKKKKKMNIFSIQKFSQNIPNLNTLERVWQSLFKVYNQTLRQMGDNDFRVEHTGVRVGQMAGTLEKVAKYDAVAFQKAWDFLASSDDEDNFFFFFSSIIFSEREQNMAYFCGDCFFCRRWPICRVMSLLKKKKFQLKKRPKFRKNHRPGHRTRARARTNITPQTYGTEKVHP